MPDLYRPLYHFTSAKNWINDPNGLVWFEGEWHLFYQYNPFGDQWGHMSWGHAVSTDLITWEELPVALAEDERHMIFSGSVVVDWQNSSGLGAGGKPPLIALYTGAEQGADAKQVQCLAYSHDKGRSWTKYQGNPVLDIGLADFRDPKVFWHAPTSKWVMVVVLSKENKARLYGSSNLIDWTALSDIDALPGTGDLWECPDMFPLPVEGAGGETRWLFKADVFKPIGRVGSVGLVMTGLFDGNKFVPDADAQGAPLWQWIDHGAEFYAAVSWSDVPQADGRRIWIGWMNNHFIAKDTPTSPWRGAMTVPRSLSLRRTGEGYRLVQQPVAELGRHLVPAQEPLPQSAFDLSASFRAGEDARFGVRMASGRYHVDVMADRAKNCLTLDRSQAGPMADNETFAALAIAPLNSATVTELRILGDACSLEVFADDGACCITALHFLPPGLVTVTPLILSGAVELSSFQLQGIAACNLWP